MSEKENKKNEEHTEQRGEPKLTQGKVSSIQEIQAIIRKEVAAEIARRRNEPNVRGQPVQPPHNTDGRRKQPPKQRTEEPCWTKVLGRKVARAGAPSGGTTTRTDGTRGQQRGDTTVMGSEAWTEARTADRTNDRNDRQTQHGTRREARYPRPLRAAAVCVNMPRDS